MTTTAELMRTEILRLFGSGREMPLRPLDLIARFGGWFEDVESAIRSLTDERLAELVRYWNPHDPFGRFWLKDAYGSVYWLGGYEYVYDPTLDLLWFVSGPDFWIRPVRVPEEVL
jgi:hypothetical protein